jgi:hypothetical protein
VAADKQEAAYAGRQQQSTRKLFLEFSDCWLWRYLQHQQRQCSNWGWLLPLMLYTCLCDWLYKQP